MLSVSKASMYLKLYDMYLLVFFRTSGVKNQITIIISTTNHKNYPKSTPSKDSINQQYQIILILILFFRTNSSPPKKYAAQMIRTSMQRYKNPNFGVGWLLWTWKLTTLGSIEVLKTRLTNLVRSSNELMDEWCVMKGYYRLLMIVTTSWWSLSKRIDLVYMLMQGFAEHWPWRMQ